MTALKTLIWSILVPGTVTVLVPYWLLSSGFELPPARQLGLRLFGLALILLGAAIYLWCAWEFTFIGKGTPAPFDPPKELVARGPYRFVRNPMYVFVFLALVGEAILFSSTTLAIYAALVIGSFHLWVVFYEEPTLRRRFGESYARYCSEVPRWVPTWPGRHQTPKW